MVQDFSLWINMGKNLMLCNTLSAFGLMLLDLFFVFQNILIFLWVRTCKMYAHINLHIFQKAMKLWTNRSFIYLFFFPHFHIDWDPFYSYCINQWKFVEYFHSSPHHIKKNIYLYEVHVECAQIFVIS